MIDFVSSQVYGLGGFESQVFVLLLGRGGGLSPTSLPSGGDQECYKFTVLVVV